MELRKDKNQRVILFIATFLVVFVVRLLLLHNADPMESWPGFKYMHQLDHQPLDGMSCPKIGLHKMNKK